MSTAINTEVFFFFSSGLLSQGFTCKHIILISFLVHPSVCLCLLSCFPQTVSSLSVSFCPPPLVRYLSAHLSFCRSALLNSAEMTAVDKSTVFFLQPVQRWWWHLQLLPPLKTWSSNNPSQQRETAAKKMPTPCLVWPLFTCNPQLHHRLTSGISYTKLARYFWNIDWDITASPMSDVVLLNHVSEVFVSIAATAQAAVNSGDLRYFTCNVIVIVWTSLFSLPCLS